MIKVKFRNKIWNVLCPENLKFPPGVIRNILIERGSKREITNIKQISIIKSEFSMETYL